MDNKGQKYFSLNYKLYVKDDKEETETLMEETNESEPLTFITGLESMLQDFEDNLYDLKAGDKFDFVIPKEKAYGEYSEEKVLDLPKSIFEVDGNLNENIVKEGAVLPMRDKEGHTYHGSVVEIGEDVIKMDFNHPLADENLHFVGDIIEAREATGADMAELSGANEGGCGSCGGCGDGGCGEGGCGSCGC